jgi:hypothetical protein
MISVLTLPFEVQAKSGIVWTPERIERTMLFVPVPGAREDLTVSSTGSADLNDADLWIVSKLRPFLSVEPPILTP